MNEHLLSLVLPRVRELTAYHQSGTTAESSIRTRTADENESVYAALRDMMAS